MSNTIKVTCSALNVRSGAGESFNRVDTVSNGKVFTVTGMKTVPSGSKKQIWYQVGTAPSRWVCGYNPPEYYVKDIGDPTGKPSPKAGDIKDTMNNKNPTDLGKGLDSVIKTMMNNEMNMYSSKYLDTSTRMLGQPFQMMSSVDYRHDSKINMGRQYLEKLAAEAPIITLIPGRPNYLPDFSKTEKKTIMNAFAKMDEKTAPGFKEFLNQYNKQDPRYFDFVPDYGEYIKYVNLLCRMMSIYMGIGDLQAPNSNSTYSKYDWSNYKVKNDYRQNDTNQKSVFGKMGNGIKDVFKEMMQPYNYVNLYVDGSNSFGESASNSTSQSALVDSLTSSIQGLAKDAAFFMGTMGGAGVKKEIDDMAVAFDSITDSKYVKKGGFMDKLIGSTTNIIQGSNILFPEIWQDSDYSKSYSFSMELISPYADKECIFLNIMVPLMHILALAIPRQTSANSYTTPFLVRAVSTGWFSCQMGIVDSIQITKGGTGDWAVNGLPTVVKVDVSIKDLYANLMVTSFTEPANYFNNQGLMDFLAVTSGMDLTKPQFETKVKAIFEAFTGRFTGIPSNLYNSIIEGLRETVAPIMRF